MISFRPAKRESSPLIIGLAGPTKSGKSLSALRLAVGMAGGGQILMLNTEPHGHQYADEFTYAAHDLEAPHRPERYVEALEASAKLEPAVLIIDSMTHMHDGIGGMLEWKDELALGMAKGDRSRADRMNAPAWAIVKAAENHFVYTLLSMRCHVILTFRAKEKVKITKEGKWLDLGWRPIMSDRIAFETMFTLMFLPYSGGVPDLSVSEMRRPFAQMIPEDRPLDEETGRKLAAWAKGSTAAVLPGSGGAPVQADASPGATSGGGSGGSSDDDPEAWMGALHAAQTPEQRQAVWTVLTVGNTAPWSRLKASDQKRLLEANGRHKQRLGG